MNRQIKIIIYSIVLVLAFLNKCGPELRSTYAVPTKGRSSTPRVKPASTSPKQSTRPRNIQETQTDLEDLQKKIDELKKYKPIDIEVPKSPYKISSPSNGYSPYDEIYGKGIYHQTDNAVEVTAPKERDIVFLLKDLSTGRFIRNEYIRRGSTFSLTKIPYGNYKFYYTYGKGWAEEAEFKSIQSAGNFTVSYGISKSDDWRDFEFERGYYGTYTLKLQLVSNGNLETESASEDEI